MRSLGNPKLLVMDEPSEGLAPTVIETMIETLGRLEQEGLAILLIEQNLGVATAVAERQLIMVGGELAHETTATQLSGDAELQRRFLGVEPLATTSLERVTRVAFLVLCVCAGVAPRCVRRRREPAPGPRLREHPGRRLRDLRDERGRQSAEATDEDRRGHGLPGWALLPGRPGLVAQRGVDRVLQQALRDLEYLRHAVGRKPERGG